MRKSYQLAGLWLLAMLLFTQVVWAAPGQATLQKARFSQTPEKIRIVLDLDVLPEYTVNLLEDPLRLVVSLPNTTNKSNLSQMVLQDDPVVGKVQLGEVEPGKMQAVIDLKAAVMYKVFKLSGPNRLVIDIIKSYEQKIQEEIMPGLTYTSWIRGSQAGPIAAYILDIDPKMGYSVKPVLSNDAIAGLETLQLMAEHSGAVAAVNGSYFALNGEILGLLKINGEIVSTPSLPRTAVGIVPGGKMLIDQVDYNGSVLLPDGRKVTIDGVNCERSPDNLILYNCYYANTTQTNSYGTEYVVQDGKISAITQGNTPLAAGDSILSAHGTAEKALSNLKVGDEIKITQTLGPVWDQSLYVLGAGPMLVKNSGVFLTTKIEQFPPDVASGRAPRTSLGLTKDGHVLLVVVDGRQKHSVGFTLLELALFMQEVGAVDAMNLDGGGSSEMVVNGKVVNKPSDGRERRVGDAFVVTANKLAN
jgi:exopolysaccharide biosynthesis protein